MYSFLIYSSMLDSNNNHSYTYGYGQQLFRIVGDRPFGRGDIVEILNSSQLTSSEYRIQVRVLGDPRVSGRRFDSSTRIELPTLIFLSSRIYLSEFSDYKIEKITNCEILSFQSAQQDRNKIYAVAFLAKSTNCKIMCREPTSKVQFEWVINAREDLDKE